MAVGGQLAVNGPTQVQPADDGRGAQVKDPLHRLLQRPVRHGPSAEGVHPDGDRPGHADGVGQLDLATVGQPRGHHVLGHPAGGVSGGTVHFGGILSGESSAAMGCGPAVGVHNDLSSGEAGIPLRAAYYKASSGIDVNFCTLIQQPGRDGGLDDQLNHVGTDLLQGCLRAVLRGDDHRIHSHWTAGLVIFHGDLTLAVGPQVVHQPLLAHGGQPLGQLVGQRDGQRHKLLCLPAGVAEHHPLVAGAAV